VECHIQLEERVADVDTIYRNSGNVLLDQLLGATLHSFPVGEDEDAADCRLVRDAQPGRNARYRTARRRALARLWDHERCRSKCHSRLRSLRRVACGT